MAHWEEAIPNESIWAFTFVYRDLTVKAQRMGGLMFSDVFKEYPSRPMAKEVRYPMKPGHQRRIAKARADLRSKVAVYNDPESFNRMLTRIGLRRYRKVRRERG